MAQDTGTALLVIYLALLVVTLAGAWKTYVKAGRGGWESLIPIYNVYVMYKLGGNPWWYLVLLFVPIVNLYALWRLYVDFARAFGKGIGWGLGLWILPVVFYPLLGFGSAQYQGPGGGGRGDSVTGHSSI